MTSRNDKPKNEKEGSLGSTPSSHGSQLRVVDAERKRVWSWGFGVDSTHGIEMDIIREARIDEIIASDPGYEMDYTYEKVIPFFKERWENLGLKVTILKRDKKIYDHFFDKKMVPLGWVSPYCSSYFKRDLIRPYIRNEYHEVIECIGHTVDEPRRIKFNTPKWLTREYPNYDFKITRRMAELYFKIRDMPYGKSSCWFCPNKSWNYFYTLDENKLEKLIVLEENAIGNPPPTLKLEGSMKNNIKLQTSLDDWDDFNCSEYCYK